MRKRSSRSGSMNRWLVAALASVLVAGLAWACEDVEQSAATATPAATTATAETTATEAPQTAAPQGAALRVFIDPQTGQPVVPPPAKTRENPLEVDPLQFSDQGLQKIVLPGGAALVRLEGRFENMLVLQIGEDGKAKVAHQPVLQKDASVEQEAANHE